MQILCKSGVCTLEIFNVKMEDAGLYKCQATNDLGRTETKCKLTVQKRVPQAAPSEYSLTHSPSYARLRTTPSSSTINSLARSATAVDVRQQVTRPGRPLSQLTPNLGSSFTRNY